MLEAQRGPPLARGSPSHRSSAQELHLGPARQPVPVPPQSLVHPHGPLRGLNWWANPCPAVRQAPACLNARAVQAAQEPPPDRVAPGCLPAAATPWNWSASRFVATAAAQVAVALVRPPVRERLDVPACPLECANRWLPVSSCSCRSLSAGQQRRHPAVRMHPPKPVQVQERPPRPWRVRMPPRRPAVPASVRVALVASGGLAVPTGMTAHGSMLCAAARRRSSARRCTSSVKTMIPWRHRPAASPANRRTWFSRRAWLVPPSPSRSSAPHPSRWRRCASARRKPPVSVSAGVPWSCGQPGKPSRCGPK